MKVTEDCEVAIEYQLQIDGEEQIVDESPPGQPFTFRFGHGQVIPGLERQIVGLEEGVETEITVAPHEGYGTVNPQMIIDVKKAELPEGMSVKAGDGLQMQTQEGASFNGTVTDVRDDSITVDFNHPLSGKVLKFRLRIASVAPERGQTGPVTGHG